jgi:hypothetical protein
LKAIEDNIDDFEEPVDLDYLRSKRKEIDTVLGEVGPERFATWIMAKLVLIQFRDNQPQPRVTFFGFTK